MGIYQVLSVAAGGRGEMREGGRENDLDGRGGEEESEKTRTGKRGLGRRKKIVERDRME